MHPRTLHPNVTSLRVQGSGQMCPMQTGEAGPSELVEAAWHLLILASCHQQPKQLGHIKLCDVTLASLTAACLWAWLPALIEPLVV